MKKTLMINDLKLKAEKEQNVILNTEQLEKNFRGVFRLRKASFEEVHFYTYDLSILRYREIWKIVLLFLKGQKRYLYDQKGNQEEINWLLFLRKDLPKLIREIFVSFFVLLGTWHKVTRISKISKKRVMGRYSIDKIVYLRTQHWIGLSAGGSVSHIYGVAKGLINSGKKLFFISTDKLGLIDKLKIPIYVVNPFKRIRNLREIPEMSYNQELFDESCRIFDREKPESIYQRYSLNNYTGIMLSLKYKIPLIIEYNGSEVWVARNWGKRLTFGGITGKIEIMNLQMADLIVVVSEVLREELLNRGIEPEKILVNPNGFDPEMYSPHIDGEETRKRYGFGDKIVVGFIGTFGPWHGAEVLAEAIKPVSQRSRNIRFLFMGDGVRIPIVKEIIKRENTEDFAILTGLVPQEEAPKYLASCDILVSPHVPNPDGSRFFGSPTKLFEYMGMAKAIVASDLEQIGEVLEHKKTAWLVKPGDVQNLAEGILKLAEDENLRNELGRNAREEALKNYTWDKNVKRTLNKLKEVLA
ncbi:MAG: glycosyltransferase family 4 protein [bacterium]